MLAHWSRWAGTVGDRGLWPTLIQTVGSLGLQSSCSYHFAQWPTRRTALVRWLRLGIVLQAFTMTAVRMLILWILWLDLRLGPLLAIEYSTWAAAATISLYGACCAQGSSDFTRFNTIRFIPGAVPLGSCCLRGNAAPDPCRGRCRVCHSYVVQRSSRQ